MKPDGALRLENRRPKRPGRGGDFQIIDFFRLLSPVEAERLQGFDDNWTEGMPERMRYFCMGNALVVPMVTRMAKTLAGIVDKEL